MASSLTSVNQLNVLTTALTPSLKAPILMGDETSKVGFVDVANLSHYGLRESFFTLGFHRSVPSLNNPQMALTGLRDAPSDMRKALCREIAPEERLVSTISLDEATNLAKLIVERFNAPVTIVRSLANPNSEEEVLEQDPSSSDWRLKPGLNEEDYLVASELQIHDLSQIRPIVQWVHQQSYVCTEDSTLFPQSYISHRDFDYLKPLFNEIAEKIRSNSFLTTEMTPEHVTCIRSLSEPWIDLIIEKCTTIESSSQLRKYAHQAPVAEPINQSELALALLIDACQQFLAPTYQKVDRIGLTEEYRATAISDCARKLYELYSGKTELKSVFRDIGEGALTLQQQRLVLIQFIAEKVSEKFAVQNLVNEATAAAATAQGINPDLLIPMAARLFAEGYQLDALPYCDETGGRSDAPGSSFRQVSIQINPFKRIIDDLRYNFKYDILSYIYTPKTNWTTPEGKVLTNAEAKQHFAQIRAEVGL